MHFCVRYAVEFPSAFISCQNHMFSLYPHRVHLVLCTLYLSSGGTCRKTTLWADPWPLEMALFTLANSLPSIKLSYGFLWNRMKWTPCVQTDWMLSAVLLAFGQILMLQRMKLLLTDMEGPSCLTWASRAEEPEERFCSCTSIFCIPFHTNDTRGVLHEIDTHAFSQSPWDFFFLSVQSCKFCSTITIIQGWMYSKVTSSQRKAEKESNLL